ncbi:MAG: TonB-dependent receptor plug domain-containing protein [Gemmatimonadota bacterium]
MRASRSSPSWIVALALCAAPAAAAVPQAGGPGAAPRADSVIVTLTRTPRSVESLTGSASVLGREELDLRQVATLEEALRDLPGVTVAGTAAFGQEVRLDTRGIPSGFGTQRTLVLLDGRPLTDEYLGNVDLAQYPLEGIARVELVRGPASALYGTNALGGVVNLVPRRGTGQPQTRVSIGGGSFDTGSASASHGRTFGGADVLFGVSGLETAGYLDNSRGRDIDWASRHAFSNVGWQRGTLHSRAYASVFRGDGTDEDFERSVARDLEDLSLILGPAAGGGDGGSGESRLRLYRSSLRQTLDWFDRAGTDFDQRSLGAMLTRLQPVGAGHLLTGGLEWRREDVRVAEAGPVIDCGVTTTSAFVQDEIAASPRLAFAAGLRLDAQERLEEVSWRVGARYEATAATTLRASAGRAFRAPTLSDRFLPETSSFGLVFAGNPDLDAEVLLSADLGVSQRAGPVRASLMGFATRARGFWDFLPDPDGVLRPRNISRVRIVGLEGSVMAALGSHVEARASYTLTDARYERFEGRDDVEGNRLDGSVPHQAAAGLTWRHPGGHAVDVGLRVAGSRVTDPENSREGRVSPHAVADLHLSVALYPGILALLSAENVLDADYRTRPELEEPGRSVSGGVRLVF